MKDYIEALREIKKENKDFKISLSRKEVLELVNEFDRLNKRVKECEEAYLRTRHQYSELENKYLTDEYIINELERHLEQQWLEWKDCETDVRFMANEDKCILEKLRELKGDSSNDSKRDV